MKKYWQLQHYNLVCNDKLLLSDFSLTLESSDLVCILGESGSGKSLLLNNLANKPIYQTNGKVVFCLQESSFDEDSYKSQYLNLDYIWQQFINELLQNQKFIQEKMIIIEALMKKPDFLFCEDMHRYLTKKEMLLLTQFLKSQKIGTLYVTNQVEDSLNFDYLIVLKNNQVAMEGNTLSVLQEEKLMKLLGYSLPFYVNLSIQLQYYDLLKNIYLSKETLEEGLKR